MNPQPTPRQPAATDFDVVVIGGAIAGSSAALLLKRRHPSLRLLVVEQLEQFPHKVGEATVEVSGYFLTHTLRLGSHLFEEHLPKHGLRYWFHSRQTATLEEMSEIGPERPPKVPSYQLDRSALDRHLLDLCRTEGIEVRQPARVCSFSLDWPCSTLEIDDGAGRKTVTTRWLLDGSGRQAFLARRMRTLDRFREHDTAAVWNRWNGVKDLDGIEVTGVAQAPRLKGLLASRRLATNHFCGDGYWVWVIPLRNGKTSIGLVYDKRHFELPGEGSLRERSVVFLRSHPGLRELLADAEPCEDDGMSYSSVAYLARQYAGRGWALLGDAAGFLDPYYSPGLDHVSISVAATVDLVSSQLDENWSQQRLDSALAAHNTAFLKSYRRTFEALYRDKYELLGDADLTSAAFLTETALYYLGVVTPIYRHPTALANPIFGAPYRSATVAYRLASLFRRRLVRLARLRRRRGTYGRRNEGRRRYIPGFALGAGSIGPLREGLTLWLRLEIETLLLRGSPSRSADEPRPASPAPSEAVSS